MKGIEKANAMDRTYCDLNKAKDDMYKAVQTLENAGLQNDADQLMKMIWKLEVFQNKYMKYKY
jgi:hypothetical protein